MNAMTTVGESLFEHAARLGHEVNRAYCRALGDESQPPWDEAPAWQRESALAGVHAIAEGRVTEPHHSHISWMEEKVRDGWTYGPTKDADAKTHPCLVPFDELPPDQQMKDHLFLDVVKAVLALAGLP